MFEEQFTIRPFVPKKASKEEFEAFTALENLYLSETDPDDPPHTVEYRIKRLTNIAENIIRVYFWVALEQTSRALVGYCASFFPLTDNLHMSEFGIFVRPDRRRQGIGKALLSKFVKTAETEQRRMLMIYVHDSIEAGTSFVERMGAEIGMVDTENQVRIDEVDRNLMRSWIEGAKERAAGFEIGFWEGLPPEEELEAVAELLDVMNSAPFDNLEIKDMEWTPERLREEHESSVKSGMIHWWGYTREIETGELAGFTEVVWNPERAYILQQYGTGVPPKFRGKGLGRWLKAAMFEKVVAERPEVKFIRTNNAASNAPMLKINHEMGFELYKAGAFWQADIKTVKAYLNT